MESDRSGRPDEPEENPVPTTRKRREVFGTLRHLPSGRYQASYIGPDQVRHKAPTTFGDEDTARAWLRREQSSIALGSWQSPEEVYLKHQRATTMFLPFAQQYIATRYTSTGEPIRSNTRKSYEQMLAGPLKPFHGKRLTQITRADVGDWRAGMLATGKRTTTAQAYRLLKAVMAEALDRDLIDRNPCRIRGGSSTSTGKSVTPPTPDELDVILDNMPDRYRALVLVAAWGGLRFGEAAELRRKDIIIEGDQVTVSVARAIADGVIGPTKTKAGVRKVILPPLMHEDLLEHLEEWTDPFGDSLVFPSPTDPAKHLNDATLWGVWSKARAAAGRPDLPWHALRHYAATRYAETGASVADLMKRMGHGTAESAMRYQHETGREGELVRLMGRA